MIWRTTLRGLLALTLSWSAVVPTEALAAPATVSARITASDGAWDYLSFDPGRRRIYVARSYGVMVIDTATGQAIDHFAQGDRSHSVVVIPDADVLLLTNSGDNTARIVDAANGALLAAIPAGKGADAAVYDPASRLAWVMNHTAGDITLVDPLKRRAVGLVAVGGVLEFAVVDGRGHLYVNVEDRNEIAVIDTRARKRVGRYRLKGCVEPTGLALTRGGLLIAACDTNAVVIRSSDGVRVASIRTGPEADAVIYDPVRERAYIPTGEDGKLWVLDVRGPRPRLIGSVDTLAGSRKGGADPATGAIYLPVAKFRPEAAADGKPVMIPGSFSVWVIEPPALSFHRR